MLVASINEKEALHSTNVEERQMLKDLEDELLDVILVFESMHGTLVKLLRNYDWYHNADANSITTKGERFDCVSEALLVRQENIILHQKKIQTLHKKLKGIINLVSRTACNSHLRNFTDQEKLSIILDLGNGFSSK